MSAELPPPDALVSAVSIGPPAPSSAPAARLPWPLRLREALSGYLPLLLMALLVVASWWLVKHSPGAPAEVLERPVSSDPDYTMTRFALERFDAGGLLKLRIEGAVLRHFPATDRTEIESPTIRAVAPDGRVTLAQAQRAIGNADASEVQLLGAAQVTTMDGAGAPLVIRSEYLHAFLVTERVRTHFPVTVQNGPNLLRAAGMEYDNATQRLDLKGPMRAVLPPRAATAAAKGGEFAARAAAGGR